MRFRVIGMGRAGGAFSDALGRVGWELDRQYRRGDDVSAATDGVPLVLLCVPDRAVAEVASAITPGDAVIVHVAGSLGLDVLAGHRRAGSIHPLMTMPDRSRGAARLLDRCHFAVAGDELTVAVVDALGGRAFTVDDKHRSLYHAAATVASNHVVALAAQVERLANAAGVPAEAYWPLMAASVANIGDVGPAVALTGPAARADWDTLRAHRSALARLPRRSTEGPADDRLDDRALYLTVAAAAARMAGHDLPEDLR